MTHPPLPLWEQSITWLAFRMLIDRFGEAVGLTASHGALQAQLNLLAAAQAKQTAHRRQPDHSLCADFSGTGGNFSLRCAYYAQRSLMLTFQELYETYAADVYRFAHWLTADSYEAEDVTSETFVRAWVHHSPIRTETLKAYLFTIARNVYLGQRRKRRYEVDLDDVHPNPDPGPDRVVESQHELQRIQTVLQTLPEVDRAAFVLRVQHDLPYAEIARVLELSLSAAKVKIHRVRKKLLATCVEKEAY